jgi:hypothetical protein
MRCRNHRRFHSGSDRSPQSIDRLGHGQSIPSIQLLRSLRRLQSPEFIERARVPSIAWRPCVHPSDGQVSRALQLKKLDVPSGLRKAASPKSRKLQPSAGSTSARHPLDCTARLMVKSISREIDFLQMQPVIFGIRARTTAFHAGRGVL